MINSKEEKICPLCGQDNECKHSNECWCFNIKVPQELLYRIPIEKRGKACICKSCIDKYNKDIQG